MFRKSKGGGSTANRGDLDDGATPAVKPLSTPANAPSRPSPMPAAPAGGRAEIPTRAADPRAGGNPKRAAGDEDDNRLAVGRGIRLKGEIVACDSLVVEGHVEANISGAKILEVTDSGLFDGRAEVQEAEISGRFQGELVVAGKLTVHATGRVSGVVRYGQIVIEAGGEITGDMQSLAARPAPARPAPPAPEAAQPAAQPAAKPGASPAGNNGEAPAQDLEITPASRGFELN